MISSHTTINPSYRELSTSELPFGICVTICSQVNIVLQKFKVNKELYQVVLTFSAWLTISQDYSNCGFIYNSVLQNCESDGVDFGFRKFADNWGFSQGFYIVFERG